MTPQEAIDFLISECPYKQHRQGRKVGNGAPESVEVAGKYHLWEGRYSDCVHTVGWLTLECLKMLDIAPLLTRKEIKRLLQWGFCRVDLDPRFISGFPGALVDLGLARNCEPSEADFSFAQVWDTNRVTRERLFGHSVIAVEPSVWKGRPAIETWGCEWGTGIDFSSRVLELSNPAKKRKIYCVTLDVALIQQFKESRS